MERNFLVEKLQKKYYTKSVVIATMLTKFERLDPIAVDLPIKYKGPNIDFFAVGSGLDIDRFYRELPGVLELVWD